MPDFMLLCFGGQVGQPTDALVMDAPDIREAVSIIEQVLRCQVDHGRTYHTGNDYDPAVTVDALSGEVEWHHHARARASLLFARPAGGQRLTAPRGS